MDFRPLNDTERRTLLTALRSNVQDNRAILMDRAHDPVRRHVRRRDRRRSHHRH